MVFLGGLEVFTSLPHILLVTGQAHSKLQERQRWSLDVFPSCVPSGVWMEAW